ncbi:hypothetical protein Ancab_014557 [Ancistrocladus abbreviatus]
MGGKCPHRSVKKRRYSHKTHRRSKFLQKGDDTVYDELQKQEGERKHLPLDDDLPGMGQYYCLHCDRYFSSPDVRDEHFKSKRHKKRRIWTSRRNKRRNCGEKASMEMDMRNRRWETKTLWNLNLRKI